MILLENQTHEIFEIKILQDIADTLTKKDIELLFVDNKTIQELNKTYRHKNTPTDVLSFPLSSMPHAPLGTIVISVDMVKKVSCELGHSKEDEVSLLFIHGLLHLLGFDHEVDSGEMRAKEEELIKIFSLPPSLIVRNR